MLLTEDTYYNEVMDIAAEIMTEIFYNRNQITVDSMIASGFNRGDDIEGMAHRIISFYENNSI